MCAVISRLQSIQSFIDCACNPGLKKRFGQHFLTDQSVLRRIVEFARIQPDDTILEIGPGGGALTARLAAAARRVVAIEIDRDLVPALRASLPANVEVVEGD